jgi:hypothetical protein
MNITEDMIEKARGCVDPAKKEVSLIDLQRTLNLTFFESLDVRREMEKRGIVDKSKRKVNQ